MRLGVVDALVGAEYPTVRRFSPRADELDTGDFIVQLKKAGYPGDVSIECGGRGGDYMDGLKGTVRVIKEWIEE